MYHTQYVPYCTHNYRAYISISSAWVLLREARGLQHRLEVWQGRLVVRQHLVTHWAASRRTRATDMKEIEGELEGTKIILFLQLKRLTRRQADILLPLKKTLSIF